MLSALAVALVLTGWFAWKHNARFDLFDWALLSYAAAWLAAALAAPWNFPAALREALLLVGGALLCLCLRAALPRRASARLRARLGGAAIVAGTLAVVVAGPPASPIPRSNLAAAARLAFSQHPAFGWGPGQFRQFTPRWLPGVAREVALDPPDLYRHHLAEGGIVATAALAFLVIAALAVLLPGAAGRNGRGRRADPAARVGLAALAGWLVYGLFASPLLAAGPMLALWIALGLGSPGRP